MNQVPLIQCSIPNRDNTAYQEAQRRVQNQCNDVPQISNNKYFHKNVSERHHYRPASAGANPYPNKKSPVPISVCMNLKCSCPFPSYYSKCPSCHPTTTTPIVLPKSSLEPIAQEIVEDSDELMYPPSPIEHDNPQPINNSPPMAEVIQCRSPTCDNFLSEGTKSTRCVDCIKARWDRIKVHGLPNSKRKSVKWADQEQPTSILNVGNISDSIHPHISGWDSELSELSSDDDGSASDTALEQQQQPTGLKIRIPSASQRAAANTAHDSTSSARARARDAPWINDPTIQNKFLIQPEAQYCRKPNCQKLLPVGYGWKLCVGCKPKHVQSWNPSEVVSQDDRDKAANFSQMPPPPAPPQIVPSMTTPGDSLPPKVRRSGDQRSSPLREQDVTVTVLPDQPNSATSSSPLQKRKREDTVVVVASDAPVSKRLCREESSSELSSSSSTVSSSSSSQPSTSKPSLSTTTGTGTLKHGTTTNHKPGFENHSRNSISKPSKPALKPSNTQQHHLIPLKHLQRKPRDPTPYPEFQSFTQLLDAFRNRVISFYDAQSYWFLFRRKGMDKNHLIKHGMHTQFAFDGEYSTIAPDFDLGSRTELITKLVTNGKLALESAGKLCFTKSRWVSQIEDGGIVTRFSCFLNLPIVSPPHPHPPTPPTPTFFVKMRGELEIAVLPDGSHPLFPGQRTVVRFRLVTMR